MAKKYYIGLDIGTESIGWAVTDGEYNLLKVRGKDYWGSYLFDEAQTAQERRSYRTARRRLARVRHRLNLLQGLFWDEIKKVDPTFFIRLNNSSFKFSDKDKSLRNKNILFDDAGYGDKQYFKQYPTIFHLRSALIDGEISDIRLLYIALHHIIKNRGHFLFGDREFQIGDTTRIRESFDAISVAYYDLFEETFVLGEDVFTVLCDKNLIKSVKQKQISELVHAGKDKRKITIAKALCGGKFALKDLFGEENDFGEIDKLCFEDANFDENLFKVQFASDSCSALIETMKAVYDLSVLQNILHGNQYVSRAKVELYESHKKDLEKLKQHIRQYCPERYNEVFRYKKGVNNYAAYIGMDRQKSFGHCSKQGFYEFLKKKIELPDDILKKMESGDFLPKQIGGENCVIPYQVHLAELQAILKNAEKKFPFLLERGDGLTVSEKIISLMTFRVPYYVGPLTTSGSRFAWIAKRQGKEQTPITPWNFDEIVDRDESERRFIVKMTGKCTYLNGEDVLPDNSLLYSEFKFLNELNNLNVNGQRLSSAKQLIYKFAKSNKKVTLKKCLDLLIKNGLVASGAKKEEVFSGIDGDFKNSLGSYNDFKRIVGELVDTNSEMCEQIILWITLISDKSRLEKLIKENYGKILTDTQIKALKGLNYAKWGRLSKVLLTDILSEKECNGDGVCLSIIESMRRSNENFMELLSSSRGYKKAIDEYNSQGIDDGVHYSTIENLYCSPAVKRSIWRAVCIVKEIIKSQGGSTPEKVFIEMAREQKDDSRKGKRTVSRKERLIDFFRSIGEEGKKWIKEIETQNDRVFNSDKVYFYYTQLGRDIYTGKPITLEDTFNTNLYDIDHIYPQSKIKDDSLDNRVLSNKNFNEHVKGDAYPLPDNVRREMLPFWTELRAKKLISDEKYFRLTRGSSLTPEECADFINRQLVETRQSTKLVAQILKRLLGTEIVYSKAGNANDFKQWIGFVKVRELNNLHHAKDAYANIVVGNVYNEKFGHDASVYFRNHNVESYNLNHLFTKGVDGAWNIGYKERVIKEINKNSCRIVRFTSEGSGKMFDANPISVKAGEKNEGLIPLKESGPLSDTKKYGGYNKVKGAYFMLVRSLDKKNCPMLTLEPITILEAKKLNGIEKKLNYCREKLGLKSPKILIEKIKINTLFNINGSYAYITGRSNNQIKWCNANELILNSNQTKYLKLISNYFRDVKKYRNQNLELNDGISAEGNLVLYDTFTEKLSSKVYAGLNIAGQAENLKAGREQFIALPLTRQCYVLMEILKFMQCKSCNADIKEIGGSANAGTVLTNKNITDLHVKMIVESPTGLYSRVINFSDFQ